MLTLALGAGFLSYPCKPPPVGLVLLVPSHCHGLYWLHPASTGQG